MYLNSGDWVENLTALEYHRGKWELYRYEDDVRLKSYHTEVNDPVDVPGKSELLQKLVEEFSSVGE
jgi:hypothetical protein